MENNFINEEKIKKISPFVSAFLGFLLGAIILFLSGFNPIEAYKYLLEGGSKGIFDGNFRRIGETLSQMTPLMLTGISVAFAFKTGLFNIGASGQMFFGGFISIFLGLNLNLPPIILPIVCALGAGVGGALIAFVPGYLKAKFGTHEVVICIMMNYVSLYLVQYLVPRLIPGQYAMESAKIPDEASLRVDFISEIFTGSTLNMGFIIAIVVLITVHIILSKTNFGYELKAVGFNKYASEYAGMKVNRNIVYSMIISGFFAGLAGATHYIGYSNMIKIDSLPSAGYDGIAVALLGLSTPIGVFISSFMFGYLKNGASLLASQTPINKEIIDLLIASIIYFSATSLLINKVLLNLFNKNKKYKKEVNK